MVSNIYTIIQLSTCVCLLLLLQGQKNKSKKVKSGKASPDKSSSSSSKSLSFYKDISSEKIQRLYQHYKYDFEIFDYSADEYLDIEWGWPLSLVIVT